MTVSSLDDSDPPWRIVFEEAWESFRSGSFGIGAVLVDPVDGSVVTTGRNRVADRHGLPRTLSGNMTAHAEMNAFASLDRFNAAGLHLYSSLEPCLMCSATALQLRVTHVHFAAADEFFSGVDAIWSGHTLTAERQPVSNGPLHGGLARFARLLPMVFTLRNFPGRSAEQLARRVHPDLAARVDAIADDDVFQQIVATGTVDRAIDHLQL